MKTIIYDLETTSVDAKTAIPRLMGFWSSENPKFQYTDDINEMVDILHAHDVIVGYNSDEYDNEIMKRYGAKFWGKVNIDLMKIIHGKGFGNDLGRKTILTTRDGTHLGSILHSKSLDATTKALDGPLKIGDFDYSLFKKPFSELTKEEQEICVEYLAADIDATKYIYDYLEEYFDDFRTGGIVIDGQHKKFLNAEQINKKYYLTSSTASLTYKIICNLADIEEVYGDNPPEEYGGGFVAEPTQETATGKIYCLDYNSLYPHIMMMCNLYGRVQQDGWKGDRICTTEGMYDNTALSPVATVLKEVYLKRTEYKKLKDEKQYTLKIILNTIYGLLGNPTFASVSDFTAAADCTRLGRQWVNAARLHFAEHGYKVLYTDTDSVYLEDVFNNRKKLMEVRDKHVQDIKSQVPFPMDTFDMGVDDEIRFMAFFPYGDTFKKKHYIYVNNDGKFVMKGIALVKSDASPLGKLVFDKYVKPEIVSNGVHKFPKSKFVEWIDAELKNDIKLASRSYKVKEPELYKNEYQIQCRIASHKLYGPGNHDLLKLKCEHDKGCGKQANYVGIQYADEVRITQLDLDKTWSELGNFIDDTQVSLEAFL